MTYQEKIALIEDGRQSLESGTSWNEFQAKLVSLPDIYQKDIDATGNKVIAALEAVYGNRIDAQLAQDGTIPSIENLDQTVINKIGERRKKDIENRLKNKVTNGILRGENPKAVLVKNAHPLLTKSLAQTAIDNVQRRNVEKKESNYSGIGIAVVVILFLLRLILRMASN